MIGRVGEHIRFGRQPRNRTWWHRSVTPIDGDRPQERECSANVRGNRCVVWNRRGTGIFQRFNRERNVQARVERRTPLPFEIVASRDRPGLGIKAQPVRAASCWSSDQFVVARSINLELAVVQRVAELLRHRSTGRADFYSEGRVTRVLDVAANSVRLRGVDDGSVINGVGVIAQQLFVGHKPTVPTWSQRISLEPELQRMVQRMHREFAIRRAIKVGHKVPPGIVCISVNGRNEFGQFGHSEC